MKKADFEFNISIELIILIIAIILILLLIGGLMLNMDKISSFLGNLTKSG